jgi:hypothetical protein
MLDSAMIASPSRNTGNFPMGHSDASSIRAGVSSTTRKSNGVAFSYNAINAFQL